MYSSQRFSFNERADGRAHFDADDGDDIVEAVGDYIYLDGGWGDDTLAASGGYNYVVGQGGVDTCFNGGEGGCTCEIKDCGDEDETSESAAVAP